MTRDLQIKDYNKRFPKTPITKEVEFAGEYLEARGFIFGTDFGVVDAIDVCSIIIMKEKGL